MAQTRIRIDSTVLQPSAGAFPPGCEWAPAALPSPPDPEGREAILVDRNALPGGGLDALVERLAPGGSIAVVVSGGPPAPIEGSSRIRRAVRVGRLAAATARAWRSTLGVRRDLRRAGLNTQRIGIGARNDGYAVSLGRDRVLLAVRYAVIGIKGTPGPTLLQRAVSRAEDTAGELRLERGRVAAAGVLMTELSSPTGERWILRMGEPALVVGSNTELLLGCDPDEAVRGRLVSPVAHGELSGLAWAVEEKRAGEHPDRMTARLWEECIGFLVALAATERPGASPGTATPPATAIDAAAVLMPHVDAAGRLVLDRVSGHAEGVLRDLPRCWGHGDFHPGNLLVDGGRLTTVLDWDAASPSALPGLDVLHLTATSDPTLRRVPHGARCVGPRRERLIGDGAPVHTYLSELGLPADARTLEALLDSYWLTRVARDVRTFPDRAERGEWLEVNLREPVAAFARLHSG